MASETLQLDLEAITCSEALSWVEDLLPHDYMVATYPKQVTMDIDKGSTVNNGQIIVDIKLRAMDFNCKIFFEGKTSNYEAHMLVKYSHSLDSDAMYG